MRKSGFLAGLQTHHRVKECVTATIHVLVLCEVAKLKLSGYEMRQLILWAGTRVHAVSVRNSGGNGNVGEPKRDQDRGRDISQSVRPPKLAAGDFPTEHENTDTGQSKASKGCDARAEVSCWAHIFVGTPGNNCVKPGLALKDLVFVEPFFPQSRVHSESSLRGPIYRCHEPRRTKSEEDIHSVTSRHIAWRDAGFARIMRSGTSLAEVEQLSQEHYQHTQRQKNMGRRQEKQTHRLQHQRKDHP